MEMVAQAEMQSSLMTVAMRSLPMRTPSLLTCGTTANLRGHAIIMLMDNAHRATSLFFFKHNIPFMAIDSPFFRNMIKAAQNCPVYTPAGRFTLCNKQLDERNAEANKFKARLLESNLMFGFTITGDGYA